MFDLLEAARNLNYSFSEFVRCFQLSHSNIFPPPCAVTSPKSKTYNSFSLKFKRSLIKKTFGGPGSTCT